VAQDLKLTTKIGEVELATPLIGASGLFGYGDEYEGLLDYASMGAIVTKTITEEPRAGNPPPRMVDVGSGIINSIGLENIGIREFLNDRLPRLEVPCKLFVSIGGATIGEYCRLAGRLDGAASISAIEVNISCPNVEEGGMAFGSDPESTRKVIEGVKDETGLAVLAKVPPVIWGLDEVCGAAIEAGADALIVANTYPAMSIDLESAAPVLGAVTGGLSGGAVKPVSLLLVWRAARGFGVPVVGVGGIEEPEDAIEFMLAGACAVQVGSAILKDYRTPSRIVEGIGRYMEKKGYGSLHDFIGKAAQQEEASGKE
jgi:dihydroorotate dehydrogenase (NAD+) catalytic subunit